jgi:hypothetical protein
MFATRIPFPSGSHTGCRLLVRSLTLATVLVPLSAPVTVLAGEGQSDADLVVAVVRELFPEVESVTAMPVLPGQPVARLTLKLGFDAARTRLKTAYEKNQRLAGGAELTGVSDRYVTRDYGVSVHGAGGRMVGSFVLRRDGKGSVIEVIAAPRNQVAGPEGPALPPRRMLPEAQMWLYPL